jgi:hypothetical protein
MSITQSIAPPPALQPPVADDIARMLMGALPRYGRGYFQFFARSGNFVARVAGPHRVRLVGCGGQMAANHSQSWDGPVTTFDGTLIAPGGGRRNGNAGGLGGVPVMGDFRAPGGNGGNGVDNGGSSSVYGGGGAAGSQIGRGGHGAAGVSNPGAGGGVGAGDAVGQVRGLPFGHLENPTSTVNFGFRPSYPMASALLIPRFVGEHFGQGLFTYSNNGVFLTNVAQPAFGEGGQRASTSWEATPMGGASVDGSNAPRPGLFGGGGPGCGGGGFVLANDYTLTLGHVAPIVVGAVADASGFCVVEW